MYARTTRPYTPAEVAQGIEDAVARHNEGYVVLRLMAGDSWGIVLVERDTCQFPDRPFVTWAYNPDGDIIHTGHYDMDLETAVENFHMRVERGY